MINFLQHSRLNICAGIELHLLPDSTQCIRVCVIELDKNELQIRQKFEAKNIEEVIKKLPPAIPLSLAITGKGILLKKVETGTTSPQPNLETFFPHLQPEHFYTQYFSSSQNTWAGIIRKEIVDDFVGHLKKNKIDVLQATVGPFVTKHILKQINVYGEELVFNGHVIKLTKTKEWEDYSYVSGKNGNFPLKIGIEPLDEQFLVAYAAAFQLALHQSLPIVKLEGHESEDLLEEYLQKKKFQHNGMAFLVMMFFLLLINFLVLQHYTKENDVLLTKVNSSAASAEQVQDKEDQIKKNETLLKELGWSRGISFAWLADQIGQTVPSGIRLSEVNINPLEEGRLKSETYQTGLIRIKGKTAVLSNVNSWLDVLQNKDWVKQVEVKYIAALDDDKNQQFTILIKY